MEISIYDLKKLSGFKEIIISDEIKDSFRSINSNIAILIINHPKYTFNKDNFSIKQMNVKNEKKNIFYLSFSEYKKNWFLQNIIRIKSFQKFEKFYVKSKFSKFLLIKFFKLIYNSDKYEFSLKKYLLDEYETFQELKYLTNQIKKENQNINIKFNEKLEIFFNKYQNQFDLKNYFQLNKFKKLLIILFYPLLIIFNNKIVFFKKKQKFKNFYRIYNRGWGIKDIGNSDDWLVKDPKNSIFVIEDKLDSNSTLIRELKKENYNYTFCNNTKMGKLSFHTIFKLIFLFTPSSICLGILIFFSKPVLFNFYYSSWLNFIKWQIFIKNYYGENYIVYHNYQYEHILRNILLNQASFKTIHYKHTASENLFNFTKKVNVKYLRIDQLYMYYNYEFHQTKQSIIMAESNKSLSEKHLISGPTFTKPSLSTAPIKYNLIFFNTSLINYKPQNIYKAHLIFLDLIIKASNNKNYKILFKSKFNIKIYEHYNLDLKQKIQKIKNLPNIDVIDYNYNLVDLMKGDTISILMPFSTPYIISLANKKKFFFVDFLNIYKNSFFSQYKNLVKNNLETALENIEVLYKSSETEYASNISTLFYDSFDTNDNIILKDNLNKFLT